MSTVINGNFQHDDDVQGALTALLGEGFGSDEIASFPYVVAPPADLTTAESATAAPDTEAEGHDPAVGGALSGAAMGSAVGAAVGLVTVPVLGPVGPLAGAGVGAYVGSLVGALSRLGDPEHPDLRDAQAAEQRSLEAYADRPREPGLLVAVVVREPGRRAAAIRIFSANGGRDLEATEGQIVGGHWVDFDASAALRPLPG